MEEFKNVTGNLVELEKDNKLDTIPEDCNTLSIEEAFKHKHVVFEIYECFEKTNINLFDNFISLYAQSYGADLEEQNKIKEKLDNGVYAVRFDPALFLLTGSLAGYMEEYKTLTFPDMKSYKNPEMHVHELAHSIGCIYRHPDGSKIENYEIYNEFNEGITEKITIEMVGKKKEAYSPHVKCTQIIDAIIGNKINLAFQKNDINHIKEAYDQKITDGSLEDLIFNMHGIKNTFKTIGEYDYESVNFEEKNDIHSPEFKQNYNAIKTILSEDDEIRLSGDKEKYLQQLDKTDEELKKFEDEIVNYVMAKEYVLKHDNGKNTNLIYERLAHTLDTHLDILVSKSGTYNDQMEVMQKFCNIQASFDFSENKVEIIENVVKGNILKLYEKMTNMTLKESADVYEKLGVQHNLKWLK